jgi:RNA polymerase sigma-70 factor (ECF subfamily)
VSFQHRARSHRLFAMLKLVPRETDRSQDYESVDKPATKETLLTQIAGGDQAAFGALYDEISPRVFGLIRRLLVDHAQSEEVTQEVFLEIWQNASRYEPSKGGASTWILTMAHRRAVDRIRSSQSGRDRDVKIGIRDYVSDYDNVADTVETTIEHERVKEAMAQLTELQRQAVTLAYYGGFSHSEVATMLSVPIGTVKTRLRDGMIRLRDELGVAS